MKTNTIILIVAALVTAAAAYWFFFMNTGNDPSISVAPPASQAQIQFQTLAGQLPTSFDTSIFDDTRFMVLEDITQPILQEPIGRIDPLAPIPGTSGL